MSRSFSGETPRVMACFFRTAVISLSRSPYPPVLFLLLFFSAHKLLHLLLRLRCRLVKRIFAIRSRLLCCRLFAPGYLLLPFLPPQKLPVQLPLPVLLLPQKPLLSLQLPQPACCSICAFTAASCSGVSLEIVAFSSSRSFFLAADSFTESAAVLTVDLMLCFSS